MFHNHLDYFRKPLLGGRPNTKLGDHGTLNAHNCWFILFYHVWGPACIKTLIEIAFGWGSGHIWLCTTLEDVTTLHDFWRCLGTAFGHFLLGSHNFMVMALGSCVKWPLICLWWYRSQSFFWLLQILSTFIFWLLHVWTPVTSRHWLHNRWQY